MLNLTKRQIDLICEAFRLAVIEEEEQFTPEELVEIDDLLALLDREYEQIDKRKGR